MLNVGFGASMFPVANRPSPVLAAAYSLTMGSLVDQSKIVVPTHLHSCLIASKACATQVRHLFRVVLHDRDLAQDLEETILIRELGYDDANEERGSAASIG
ncbi:uncharacterized protein PG986_010748 [Apiospora aurea]|uniref:Uncharacterized protein n=1 Tax=Apiospora aurea TaxID=335848 RepID=A0ABR1Q339_9PEZI